MSQKRNKQFKFNNIFIVFQLPKMETIFFLSSLPDDLYQLVLEVLNKYGKLETKGQKAKTKDLKAGLKMTRLSSVQF